MIGPEDRPTADHPPTTDHPRWVRWCRRALIAAGTLTIGYAVAGALADPDSRLGGQLLFLAGVLVAHDAVLMPLVIAVGALIGRLAPGTARAAVRVGAYLSLCLILVTLPAALALGRPADNPSALPLPYGRNLAAVLIAVWAAVLVHTAYRSRRRGP